MLCCNRYILEHLEWSEWLFSGLMSLDCSFSSDESPAGPVPTHWIVYNLNGPMRTLLTQFPAFGWVACTWGLEKEMRFICRKKPCNFVGTCVSMTRFSWANFHSSFRSIFESIISRWIDDIRSNPSNAFCGFNFYDVFTSIKYFIQIFHRHSNVSRKRNQKCTKN